MVFSDFFVNDSVHNEFEVATRLEIEHDTGILGSCGCHFFYDVDILIYTLGCRTNSHKPNEFNN